MQLSEAIEGWLAAHAAGLSTSTRRDIADIAASADRCGYGWMDCIDVRAKHLGEIVTDADAHSSLNAPAIRQFLEIAVDWALTQGEAPVRDAFSGAALASEPLPSDTDGWVERQHAPVIDDLDEISWVDDLPDVDDLDVDQDGELDPLDDDQFFEVDDMWAASEPQARDNGADGSAGLDAPLPETPDDEALIDEALIDEALIDEALIDEDDFDVDELALIDDDLTATDEDELDADELALIDSDLTATDEDELDADELALIDSDLASLNAEPEDTEGPFDSQPDHDADLFDLAGPDDDFFDADLFAANATATKPGADSAFSVAAGRPADPAASSFLRTLEETGQTPAVFGDLAEPSVAAMSPVAPRPIRADVPAMDTAPSGIFSEAAQYDGERSVDWITVAYFAVAAICFAFVIYLALTN